MAPKSSFSIEDSDIKRTGTWLTASAHIVTTAIGSGVLSLAWAVAQLGWIGGTAALIIFSLITLLTSILMADCYRYPDSNRNSTYMKMVKTILGGVKYKYCGFAQYTNLVGCTIGYTLTAAISMVAMKQSNCFHKFGHQAHCDVSSNQFMAIFGVSQIFLSQIPNFHDLSWLSILAAIMSFGYSFIGIGLSIAQVAEKGHHIETGLTGAKVAVTKKVWNTFQAIANIAFAYTFSNVIAEIEDTLKPSPPENQTMKIASIIGIASSTILYGSCGLIGYAAFGNSAPGNFLTGFGFYEPFWLIDIGNLFIIIHLVGAYQVFAQPIFSIVESWVGRRWPESKFLTREYNVRIPLVGTWRMNVFRVIWRSTYVVFTTLVAMILPFFNNIVGLIGALSFFPLTVYFPIEMHITRVKVPKYSLKWIGLKLIIGLCLIVALMGVIASIQGIISELTK
ncbi:amino acid permease 6-like isoform X2 [Vicia villosa]|uniref:amino acid permease 6-like isoform X2 n=1 Tax=Vicia villosa TaxID=3911 RepID=UPI00273BE0DE|nr:amino acid permease 6-like isoform X2 [Vicia villosa]